MYEVSVYPFFSISLQAHFSVVADREGGWVKLFSKRFHLKDLSIDETVGA